MHLVETQSGDAARRSAASAPPFGPGFPAEVVQKTERLEVWGTSFSDPGPDFCEFRAFDKEGVEIECKRLAGY